MACANLWPVRGDLRRVLVHGAGRDIESVPDLYPQDQASSMHSLYYIGNGAGKRNRSIHILLQPVVGIK